jgi:hypothetical protein
VPLSKGSSKKTFSKNVAELRGAERAVMVAFDGPGAAPIRLKAAREIKAVLMSPPLGW